MRLFFSPYVHFTTEAGLEKVKVRMWHPAIAWPNFKHWLRYWYEAPKRYRAYELTLLSLHVFFSENAGGFTSPQIISFARNMLKSVDCGYSCSWHKEYGFVPEADCPIHDI